jgi:MOSC domain-containing protein YiiM
MSDHDLMKIKHLYISSGHNFFGHHGGSSGDHIIEEKDEIRCIAGRGIEGDRFLDFKKDYKGQITFFSSEIHQELCELFSIRDKPASAFRRNVITVGQDLNSLIGAEFEIQGVRFFGTAECSPCYWMDEAFHRGTEKALSGRGGLRAKILTTGKLRITSRPQE